MPKMIQYLVLNLNQQWSLVVLIYLTFFYNLDNNSDYLTIFIEFDNC